MVKFRLACVVVGFAIVSGCQPVQSSKPVAVSTGPISSATAPTQPSVSPSATPASPLRPVLAGLSGANPAFTVARLDGSVVASVPASNGVGDEHAVGAYLLTATDGSGKEWAVDTAGVVRPVSPIAAKLLSPNTVSSLLVLDSTTAIVGCQMASNGDCTAQEIRLDTGATRVLLTATGTGPAAMGLGPSLKVLDVSLDLRTVWFREVTSATVGAQGPTGKVDIAGVDRITSAVTRHDLPVALLQEQDLAISRDGKWAAAQEDAGTNSAHLAIRHLHVISLATGVDRDVQGTAPYVGGQRSPSILFAPDSSRVVWWGGLNNGSSAYRVNTTAIGGTGKSVYPNDGNDVNGVLGVFWLDPTTLVVERGGIFAVNADTGSATQLPGPIDYLLGVLN